MEDLIKKIAAENEEFGEKSALIPSEGTPESILMIDQKTIRKCSPQMKEFFSIVEEWNNGIKGQSVVNPKDLSAIYKDVDVSQAINLASENYKPVPPSDATDWDRTALFAKEDGGLGLFLYWWENEENVEPSLVEINGGTIVFYKDILSCLREVSSGEADLSGEEIYSRLERQRGTLGD